LPGSPSYGWDLPASSSSLNVALVVPTSQEQIIEIMGRIKHFLTPGIAQSFLCPVMQRAVKHISGHFGIVSVLQKWGIQ
jgi:hypothetical protein